ncbi:MAG: hypothetical protein FJX37_02085 [Alphaproteobacteria bacterium]|nr:hypothetical protein [Alphaproteobacteria bacterium]MBM3642580.1 hypothetical protein [Alphaproteobacteria bacterium]MBM3951357.1 hypothetical protein [Rhodospirillales bacterium]
MSKTTPGEKVLVPTEVKAGAFPGEMLVTVITDGGPISGFARENFVVKKDNNQYLMAEVKKITDEKLTVKLFGSFFTTTGVADLPRSTHFLKATG